MKVRLNHINFCLCIIVMPTGKSLLCSRQVHHLQYSITFAYISRRMCSPEGNANSVIRNAFWQNTEETEAAGLALVNIENLDTKIPISETNEPIYNEALFAGNTSLVTVFFYLIGVFLLREKPFIADKKLMDI